MEGRVILGASLTPLFPRQPHPINQSSRRHRLNHAIFYHAIRCEGTIQLGKKAITNTQNTKQKFTTV